MDNTRADPRPLIIFLLLLSYWQFTPEQPQAFPQQRIAQQHILQEHSAVLVLNSTDYGAFNPVQDRWLNLTGFRKEDEFAWLQFDDIKARAQKYTTEFLKGKAEAASSLSCDAQECPYVYRNVTGYLTGQWIQREKGLLKQPSSLNLSAVDSPSSYSYGRNVSGSTGSVQIRLQEVQSERSPSSNDAAREISALVTLEEDTGFGNWWEMKLHGVHYPISGGVLLTTTSEKFGGIFALPHLALSLSSFHSAKELLSQTVVETINKQVSSSNSPWNPWSSIPGDSGNDPYAPPQCEYVVYLQQEEFQQSPHTEEMSENQLDVLQLAEHELRFPTGAPVSSYPPLRMSMVAFSPDCGFLIESKGPPDFTDGSSHLAGPKLEMYLHSQRLMSIFLIVLLATQVLLVIRQNRETCTPSTRSRVSFYTIAMLSFGDGFLWMVLVSYLGFMNATISTFFAAGFLALLSFVFEVRFLQEIWAVQSTERAPSPRANTARPNSVPTTGTGGPLPLPATARRQSGEDSEGPAIVPSDQDTEASDPSPRTSRTELPNLLLLFFFLIVVVSFLSLIALSWPIFFRSVYANTIGFLYLSFWCPQIYRNTMRNCRKALRWEFVLGQTIVRLIPFGYFYTYSGNVLFATRDVQTFLVFVAWVSLQILLLIGQSIIGPRFFIRDAWAPPAYDYHPLVREDEESALLPVGGIEKSAREASKRAGPSTTRNLAKYERTFECSICTLEIDIPVYTGEMSAEPAFGLGSSFLTRRAYMITPCRHVFHTHCLEGWMRYRLQCPNCRETLPPL